VSADPSLPPADRIRSILGDLKAVREREWRALRDRTSIEGPSMKLLNFDRALVSGQKAAYLLNPILPGGTGNANFSSDPLFCAEQWQILAETLNRLTPCDEVARSVQTGRGWEYAVEGEIETPDDGSVVIRTMWIVENGHSPSQLVTACPLVLARCGYPGSTQNLPG